MDAGESPVFSFLTRPSLVDFPGHLSGVFFVSGCNFRCGFCHNATLLAARQAGVSWARLAEVCDRFRANWVDAAVISGGEPTLRADLPALVSFFRERGWSVKLDTNGSRPDALGRLVGEVACVAMDVKAAPPAYAAATGFSDIGAIRASIDTVRRGAGDYEFRTTVIDTLHTDTHMHEIGAMIERAKRWVLQPFVPRAELLDSALCSVTRTSRERLLSLQALMRPYAQDVVVRGE